MNTRAKVTIAVLGGAVLALGVALGFAVWDGGGDDGVFAGHMGDGFQGMMTASSTVDSGQMLERMAQFVGPDAYQAMLSDMAEFHQGQTPSDSMHQMMHGMMHQTPGDPHHVMPFQMMHP